MTSNFNFPSHLSLEKFLNQAHTSWKATCHKNTTGFWLQAPSHRPGSSRAENSWEQRPHSHRSGDGQGLLSCRWSSERCRSALRTDTRCVTPARCFYLCHESRSKRRGDASKDLDSVSFWREMSPRLSREPSQQDLRGMDWEYD